jgi:hypothetical protein
VTLSATIGIEASQCQGPVDELAAWEHAVSLDEALASLPRIAAAGAQVEQHLVGWVRRARALGATWARIGEALGMTRQSAWERVFGRGVERGRATTGHWHCALADTTAAVAARQSQDAAVSRNPGGTVTEACADRRLGWK